MHQCRRSLQAAAGLVAVLGIVPAVAQVESPTNFELVRDAATSAGQQLVESLRQARPAEPLALQAVGKHDGNFLVESTLSSVLAREGYGVRVGGEVGPVLEFEVVDLGVAYTRVRRPAWLGSKRVEREARARLFVRLLDAGRENIVWSDQVEAKILDEVQASRLAELEDRNGSDYLRAEMPERRWNKLVEPVVVTGIVIGLIFLFFSNQDVSR